ncbi:MAG: outer membrane beta-barrel protein, partial [Bacteroidales bacterium]|nr:outer membrane beta-barrel protein [Bacteroidales bacterium]
LDRKLSLSVRLSDIFNSRRFESESWGPGFNTKSLRKRDSRVFYVGVSYRINNYQQRRDRLRTLEDNSMEPSEF